MKTLKKLTKALKDFSNEELMKEVERRNKKKKGRVLGYRGILYGDEYDYGFISTYLIGEMNITKKQAKQRAEESVENSNNGGYVETLYKDNVEWPEGRKVH